MKIKNHRSNYETFLTRNIFKELFKKNKNLPQIWCIVLHPVEYQIPFYECLYKLSKHKSLICFMDSYNLKPFKASRWGEIIEARESTNPKNYKFKYFFCKNLSPYYESIFFNRVNLDIIFNIVIYQPKIAIITSYTSFTTFIILLLAPFLKTKICLRAEGGLIGRQFLRNRNTIPRKLVDWLIKRADYFFYSCDDNKEYFLTRGIKENKLYPLLSSVDSKFFNTKSKKPKINYEYFLIASKLEKRKNVIEAILGYKKYVEKSSLIGKNFPRLIIAGTGPESNFLKKEENKHIIFYDYVKDQKLMRSLLQGSIGLIISSLYDPSPKIVNEAMACSKTVLCRDTVGFAGNLIEHKKNGYIYNPFNEDDILLGYRWLEENKDNKKIKNFCKKKSNFWSPEQNAESVVKLFNKI